jgi:hypothetical protein
MNTGKKAKLPPVTFTQGSPSDESHRVALAVEVEFVTVLISVLSQR